ncbi:DUF1631 family protein [Luteimonas terrae]|uniref:DUF1631 family protein n=1 Tax=Luteimonas terrae TaxID=1530191 RepID=A0ABU1XVG0_9GAMM|nr:DUF1631 family protein [Luteimonas terrae]MDR7192126.1 hypothetical protein [Luteimonas terrae]
MPVSTPGQGDAQRAETPAQLMEGIRRETTARLLPLLGETLRAERARLQQACDDATQGAPAHDADVEDLTSLTVLAAELIQHEHRWQKALGEVFAAWPEPPLTHARSAFSLLSDDELQAQLIGQPVAEALDRRFESQRDIIDRRLHTLATRVQYRGRPCNPLSARFLVECFLRAFAAGDCGRRLRALLLRRHELLLDGALGALYAWCNTRLAEAGCALAGDSDHAALLAGLGGSTEALPSHRTPIWEQGNAVMRAGAGVAPGLRADAPRGNVLRRYARRQRDARRAELDAAQRSFRRDEFLSTLSLLQSERSLPAGETHAIRLREGLYAVAAGLGIDRQAVAFDGEQDEALILVGAVFDLIAARHQLTPPARERLALLAVVWVHLALEDMQLFEPSSPPAMQLLSALVELWDGVDPEDPQSIEQQTLADRAADAVLDSPHGDGRVFPAQLAQIDAALAANRRRAEAVERRTWQALRGRERLDAARRQARSEVSRRLEVGALLPSVAGFLDVEWRRALEQAWLRDGEMSDRYREVLSLGDALLESDALAANDGGSAVADRLLGILPALRDCCAQSGNDADATEARLAGLVAEHASQTPRRTHMPTPPATADAPLLPDDADPQAGLADTRFVEGQRFVQPGAAGAARRLRLAWRSALSGACLLVDATGARQWVLMPADLHAMIEAGQLQPRPSGGAVSQALATLAAQAGGG